jgi:hypothetical protein
VGIARRKKLLEGGRLRERWKLLKGNYINEQNSRRGLLKGREWQKGRLFRKEGSSWRVEIAGRKRSDGSRKLKKRKLLAGNLLKRRKLLKRRLLLEKTKLQEGGNCWMKENSCKKGNSRKQGNFWRGGVADRREIEAGGRKLLEGRRLQEGKKLLGGITRREEIADVK